MRRLLLPLLLLGCRDPTPVEWHPAQGNIFGDSHHLFQSEAQPGELVGPHAQGTRMVLDLELPVGGAGDWTFKVLEPSIATATTNDQEGPYILELDFLEEGSTDLYAVDPDGVVVDIETLRVRRPEGARVSPYDELQFGTRGGSGAPPRSEGPIHTVQGALLDLVVTYVDRLGVALAGGGVVELEGDFPPRIDQQVQFTGEVDVISLDVGDNAPVETLAMTLSHGDVATTMDLVVHDRDEVDAVSIEVANNDGDGAAIARVSAAGQVLAGAFVTFSWDGVSQEGTVLALDGDSDVQSTPVTACFEGTDPPVCTEANVPGEPTGVLSRDASTRTCGCDATSASPDWGWLARRR